jgi:hypothetical protein
VKGALKTTLAWGCVTAGFHSTRFNAEGFARGVYVLKFETEDCSTTAKLVVE